MSEPKKPFLVVFILAIVAAIPIIVMFWSRWKLILGLVFGISFVGAIVWIVLLVRSKSKKKKCNDESKEKEENKTFEEKVHGLLSELKPGISY